MTQSPFTPIYHLPEKTTKIPEPADGSLEAQSSSLEGEILAPLPKKTPFLLGYVVQITGERSGVVHVRGTVIREATDAEEAKRDVFLYLTKSQFQMYPVIESGRIKLMTPEFPPDFNGRPMKVVSVWEVPHDSIDARNGQAETRSENDQR